MCVVLKVIMPTTFKQNKQIFKFYYKSKGNMQKLESIVVSLNKYFKIRHLTNVNRHIFITLTV